MRQITLSSLGLLLAVVGCGRPDRSGETPARAVVEPSLAPPSSLDALYPPRAEAPVYLMRMFDLSAPLAGLAADLGESDFENAAANYEEFRRQYEEVSSLVPEWAEAFPMTPIGELGLAIESRDPAKIAAASQAVADICHDCHVLNMVPAQQRYRWPKFSAVRTTDPVLGTEVGLADYMMSMEVSFAGMMNDLRQGQLDRARELFRGFAARFQKLPDLCTSCHDTEREYFVDAGVQNLVNRLEIQLESSNPDPARIGALMERIGTESCGPCHLVHLPAAYAQDRWETAH